jgi:hypothetical protein
LPPRNYFARGERMRLWMIVGGVALAVILFRESPRIYRFLTADFAAAGDDGEPVDTRIPIAESKIADLPGTVVGDNFRFRPKALDNVDEARRRLEKDLWQKQIETLELPQQRLLPTLLNAARDGTAVPADVTQAWPETLAQLDTQWREYAQTADSRVTSDTRLSEEDRGAWLLILHQLRQQWDEQLHPALAAATQPKQLTAQQREQLVALQTLLVEMSLDAIRDDTVVSRPEETFAWFRLFESLQKADAQTLASPEIPEVGFRQLDSQPGEYRGRLVRVRGQAWRIDHASAPKNHLGITDYYIIYLWPDGGPTFPIRIYALDLPAGFPPLRDAAGKPATLKEPMEVTGYFMKRCAYLATDGSRRAPLILAKSPTWNPRPVSVTRELPAWQWLLAAAVGAAVLGTVVSIVVLRQTRATPAQKYASHQRVRPQELAALADEPVNPPTSQMLRQLAAAETQAPSQLAETDRASED